ncbi:hypothetical protein [Burkholderia phage BCSR129]|nr:hypothetical protein [Burkholderia phage BCSR129]
MDARTRRAFDSIERMRGLAGVRSYPGEDKAMDAIARIRRIGDEQQRKANGQFGSGGGGSSSAGGGGGSAPTYERAHRNPQGANGPEPMTASTKQTVFGGHSGVTERTNPSTGEVSHEVRLKGFGSEKEVKQAMSKLQKQWEAAGFQKTRVEGIPAYKGPQGTIVYNSGDFRRDPQTGAATYGGSIQFYPVGKK